MESEKTNPTSAVLMSAMHAHLQAIAQRPIDATMLLELHRTCDLARKLFAIGRDPAALGKNVSFSQGYIDESGGYLGPALMPAPINPTETFGVQAIKELVALIPEMMPKPAPVIEATEPPLDYSSLASAMAVAKGAGDDKLYLQLLSRLEAEQRRAELVNRKLEAAEQMPSPKALPVPTTRCQHVMAGTDGERCWLAAGHPDDHRRSSEPNEKWPGEVDGAGGATTTTTTTNGAGGDGKVEVYTS